MQRHLLSGPFKLLYNAVSVALTSRIFSAKIKDLRASCYYHVSKWSSSYVINQNVLLDDEKTTEYNLIKDSDGKLNYAKNISGSNQSILEFYRKSIYDYLADQYSIALQEIDTSNIEFYIEVTNPDVIISNSNRITETVPEIPTSYNLFRVNQESIGSPLHAYTNAPSARFSVPGGFGAYVLRQRAYKSSLVTQDNLSLKISSRNIYQSYGFKFSIFNSYVQSSESPIILSADWSTEITATYNATLTRKEFWVVKPTLTSTETENVLETAAVWSKDEFTAQTDLNQQTVANQTEVYALADDRLNGEYRLKTAESSGSRNHYIYTRDIDNGNVNTNYKKNGSHMLAEYIAYIQITLREAKALNNDLLECPLTRKYDAKTEAAVLKFQQVYKARVKDGIVDSETKSLFSREVWKKMYQTQRPRYDEVTERIKTKKDNKDALKYIEHAATVAEIWELINVKNLDFQKISYTGTEGPTQINDIIYIAIPAFYRKPALQKVQILKMKIVVGKFKNANNYKGISLKEVRGYAYNVASQTADYNKSILLKSATAASTGTITIDINKPLAECGVVSIKLTGSKLGGKFGAYAEGYSITSINFDIKYEFQTQFAKEIEAAKYKIVQTHTYSKEEFGYADKTQVLPAVIKYKISGKVDNISANRAEQIDLSGIKSVKFTTEPLSITYPNFSGSATLDLKTTKIDFSSTNYKPPFSAFADANAGATPNYKDESITIDLTSSKTIEVNSSTLSVSNVLSATKNPVNSNSVVVSTAGNKLFFETSSLNYQNSNIIKSSISEINNYWLLKADGSLIQKSKNSISVLDGLLMLCQPSTEADKVGKPYGISLQSFVSNNSGNIEFNIDYGAFVLQNQIINLNNGGLLYGFYDRLKKEFIGQTLYYVDYISRGPENIYIAVLAMDADGNVGDSDFLGVKNTGIIIPPIAPVKIACPIYHVSYIPSSRISLSSIPPNLSQLDQWPLYVTSGSFTKEFYIDPEYGSVNWLQNYNGKTLRATYSTLDVSNVLWSQILGKPYVDVLNEYPIFLSSRKIQLSQIPIASYIEPSANKIGILKQYLFIETRKSDADEWEVLDSKFIRNINCDTGVIDLTKDLSQDTDLIRVSYAVKASGIPLKHVNGNPIPLNPFLNQDLIEPEKPLYIYIKPSKIEVKDIKAINSSNNLVYSWNHISDYVFDGVVHFTYDNNIFNQYDSVSYDPLAIQIGLIHVLKNTPQSGIDLVDLRVKGGGLKSTYDKSVNIESYGSLDIEKVLKETKEAVSFWDVYPPDQQAYPKGGFIIIKLPKAVLNNFVNKEDVYSIIRRNITAGVVFKIQDMDGNDWITV